MEINVNYSFTEDTPNFWKDYWSEEMGKAFSDPDISSKNLKLYHQIIWSKRLPNGEIFDLKLGNKNDYLIWKDFKFGSDSIVTSFRYKNNKEFMEKVISQTPNYQDYIIDYTKKGYTIGGAILFPKMKGGINQTRGMNPYIKDRFDLTLECIKKYYKKEISPLTEVLEQNKKFFDLFLNFKEYVNFFFLQDLVSDDYSEVKFWIGNGLFNKNPLPKTVEEYHKWINEELEFVKKRNARIKDYTNSVLHP